MKQLLVLAAWLLTTLATVPAFAQAIDGAGSTFAEPLYAKLFLEYARTGNGQPTYQAIGSGAGIERILERSVDFGASDTFLSDARLRLAPGPLLHVPVALGAVAVIYNLGLDKPLKLDGPTIAELFLGRIKNWNDPAIAALNPGVKLPNLLVTVVHRSGGSGTTSIFVDFLGKTSSLWAETVSIGPTQLVSWPTGLNAPGNDVLAGLVKRTPGAIGYSEFATALFNQVEFALVKNASGRFVAPNPQGISSAAAQVNLPADTRVGLTNAGGSAYPIAGFTWALVYRDQRYDGRSLGRSKALSGLLWWIVHEGQAFAEPLGYARLPKAAVARAEAIIRSMRYGNAPCLP